MRIGYARVSTETQDHTSQREALAGAGCSRIFAERVSGASRNRIELERALDLLRDGDVLVVTALDRLARSTLDLLAIAERIGAVGAGLQSLGQPWADTTTPGGRMVLTVFAGLAEFERELIRERTREGIERARAAGVPFGRTATLSPERLAHARDLIGQGKPARDVARLLGVHRSTLHRALRR
jgi:DNA invertase Pin-like site-specific DNA recombinase